jgi:ABC-type amino acid transport substrate-binding protein
MNKLHVRTAFLALLVLIILGCQDSDKMNLIIGVDPTFPPMESLDNKGNPIGLDIDMINAAAKAGGFKVSFVCVPWDSIFYELQAGRIDAIVSSVSIFDWRKETIDFSSSYYDSPQVIVVPKAATDVTSLNDLRGRKVGVVRGSVAASFLEADAGGYGIVSVEYDNYDDPYYDLVAGRLSGMIGDSLSVDFWLRDPKIETTIRAAGICPFTEQIAVAVKKGNGDVLRNINKGIASISASGKLTRIAAEWIHSDKN